MNDNTAYDPIGASNLFHIFFISIGKNLVDNLSENTNTDLIVYDKSDMQVFDEILLKSVRGKIDYKCSRDDTAAGYNMITVKILKCISKHIVNHLVYIHII